MKRKKAGKIVLIVLGVFILLFGAVSAYALHTPSGILAGVTVNGAPVGALSREEAVNLLTDTFGGNLPEEHITFTFEGHEASVPLSDLSPELLIAETVQAADSYGKDGNLFTRLGEKIAAKRGNADLPLLYKVDEEKVRETVRSLTEFLPDAAVENQDYLDTEKSAIVVINGTRGNVFDREAYTEDLMHALGYRDFAPIELISIHQESDHPSAKELAEKYEGEPQNATYEVVGYAVAYTEGVPGVTIDREKADEVLAAHTGEGEEFSVPVGLILPETDVAALEEQLFGHRLSTYTTRFNTGDRGRSKNVALASEKINGTVLAPGAVFSYNEVVGERTTEQGFQIAKVYSGGKSVDGIGGGICQVSSTLYNTALYANLEIVSRRNHQLPVSYVPLGQDATVVYGATDFKFKNSTDHPIKITSTTYQGTLTVSIYGTPYEKETVVTLSNETVGVIPYGAETVEDETLAFGETRVEQKGANGYKVKTYIKVTEDGEVVRSELLSTSTYNPKAEITAVSTQTEPPASEAPSGEPSEPPENEPAVAPTADPDVTEIPTILPAEDEVFSEEFE